jgi:hypothetical protein
MQGRDRSVERVLGVLVDHIVGLWGSPIMPFADEGIEGYQLAFSLSEKRHLLTACRSRSHYTPVSLLSGRSESIFCVRCDNQHGLLA